MKKQLKLITAIFIGLLIANFSFGQVTSDYDKNVDFTKYKTYKFEGWEKDSDKILNDFDKTRILEAFKNELSSRGLNKAENDEDADVGITLFLVVDDKTSTSAYTTYNGGMGYGAGRWGWGMGMGSSTTTYSEDDYKEGTMVVDFYDIESKELVWQGVMQTVVQEKPEKREKTIPKKVAKLMKAYPVKPIK
ncbi:DUF4136 domain-containing protein [Flexithrix dorotheae]|uniref:DUF4136 domain-containing protein n=1 Tax=Flexithrix dorotheae TaxID=70993 RepID=UPI000381BB81|nr:DUF4136 domain-containing protein [Flexithrix dorotheae]